MRPILPRLLAVSLLAALSASLPGSASAEDAPAGSYECWYFSTPQPQQNFNLKGASYTDASGASGSVESSGGKLHFSGGNLNGQTAVYKGGNPPTISFIDGNGEEQFFCQLAK